MVRSLLLAFRSLSLLEKTVDTCCLQIDHINCNLDVSFTCRLKMLDLVTLTKERSSRHSVGKEFSLGLLEYENTRPMYDINEVKFFYVLSGV